MSHPSGGRLAELTRAAVVRVAALTGRVDAATARPGGPCRTCSIAPAAPCPTGGWTRAGRVTSSRRPSAPPVQDSTGHARTDGQHWHSWTATDADPATLVHKIYVSPAVCDIATTLGVILTHAPLLGVPAWKVGADLAGLHRPDKIVLYLGERRAGRPGRRGAGSRTGRPCRTRGSVHGAGRRDRHRVARSRCGRHELARRRMPCGRRVAPRHPGDPRTRHRPALSTSPTRRSQRLPRRGLDVHTRGTRQRRSPPDAPEPR